MNQITAALPGAHMRDPAQGGAPSDHSLRGTSAEVPR